MVIPLGREYCLLWTALCFFFLLPWGIAGFAECIRCVRRLLG